MGSSQSKFCLDCASLGKSKNRNNSFRMNVGNLINESAQEIRVGMLGLENAGKTTILYHLKTGTYINPIPTIGFNVETIRFEKYLLNIWDVSGAKPQKPVLWKHYNRNTRAIIFVVDASDVDRLPKAAEELRWIVRHYELKNAVFLIYANKQDLNDAMGAEDIVNMLELTGLTQQWSVQECCAMQGVGLNEGLQQLMEMYDTKCKLLRCSICCDDDKLQ